MIAGSAMLLHVPHWDTVRPQGFGASPRSPKNSYQYAIDLGETLKICDVGDILLPANITKPTTGSRLSLRSRSGAVHGRQGRDHPPRPTRGHAREGYGRDHAHLPLVPRDKHAGAPPANLVQLGTGRLASPSLWREGVTRARHHVLDCQGDREDRGRQDDRNWAASGVEGGPRML